MDADDVSICLVQGPDRKGAHRLRETLQIEMDFLRRSDRPPDQAKGLAVEQDSATLRLRLQPGCQIHGVTDRRIVESVLGPEVANGAESGRNADAESKAFVEAPLVPPPA